MRYRLRITLSFLGVWLWQGCGHISHNELNISHMGDEDPPALMVYGFNLNEFEVNEGTINDGEFFSEILSRYSVEQGDLHALATNARDTFDVRKIRAGHKFMVLSEKDSSGSPQYFIYEKDQEDYVVFCLQDSLYAYCGKKPVQLLEREVAGQIESSLYDALTERNIPAELAMKMADLYAWTIDFYRIQKGDYFKMIFEERLVDGNSIGAGTIKAALFNHKGEEFYAFNYDAGEGNEYFDEKGRSLRKAFLKAPLKFSRISSRYTMKRFHPVLKRYKAHLGTDYAAPHGTPILAVGDGTVIKSEFAGGNGNYVKIRHNSVYETQYLHMSKRAVKAGERVKQGQVIGYVGSTGLATGPHVCFRFWKNGAQVDHLAEKFPESFPVPEEKMGDFRAKMNPIKTRLSLISLGESAINAQAEPPKADL